jgi:hypothetical protein
MALLLVDALGITSGARVDFEELAFIDEERH